MPPGDRSPGGGGTDVSVGSKPRELYAFPMLDLIKSIKDLGFEAPRPSGAEPCRQGGDNRGGGL